MVSTARRALTVGLLAVAMVLVSPGTALGHVTGERLLMFGTTGQDVATWQENLNRWLQEARPEQGQLAVDGIYGPRTEAATRDFQSARGIAVDGIVGPQTRGAMAAYLDGGTEPPPSDTPPLLSRGDTGPAVGLWQDQLNDWLQVARTEQGRLAVDGIYGPRTEAATRDFQSARDIAVDGIVGPETRGEMAEFMESQ